MDGAGAPIKGHVADALGLGNVNALELVAPIGEVFRPRRVQSPMDRLTRSAAGKRSSTRTRRKRGRYIQAQPAAGDMSDIAVDATIRQAAALQVSKRRR